MERGEKRFYGWVIVAVMAVAGAANMAMATLNYGLFIKPMGDDLGIGRAVFGLAQTTRQVSTAATSPLIGGLLDRFGARVMLAVAAAVTGAALIALGFIGHGWQLIVLFALMGLVGLSGPGALVTTVPVAKWFVRKRGKAMSFVALGIPIGAVIFIPLTQLLIDLLGWRTAWVVLALIGTAMIVPLSLIFVRREPEDLGLRPDGEIAPLHPADSLSNGASHSWPPEQEWTRQQALRSATFWRLTFTFSLVMLALGSVAVHRIPHFMDQGLDARLVAYATALDAVAAGISSFTVGLLADRLPARFLGMGGFLFIALGIFFTTITTSVGMMFLAMITFGAGIGGLMLIQNYVWADYFGRQHLGSIRGVVTPITLVVGGIGAPLAGFVRDATGSYTGIWLVGMALFVVGAIILALTPPPGVPPVVAVSTPAQPTAAETAPAAARAPE
ncbi:MAG: MFS transporter [Dehalococcoidia bacterium]